MESENKVMKSPLRRKHNVTEHFGDNPLYTVCAYRQGVFDTFTAISISGECSEKKKRFSHHLLPRPAEPSML